MKISRRRIIKYCKTQERPQRLLLKHHSSSIKDSSNFSESSKCLHCKIKRSNNQSEGPCVICLHLMSIYETKQLKAERLTQECLSLILMLVYLFGDKYNLMRLRCSTDLTLSLPLKFKKFAAYSSL